MTLFQRSSQKKKQKKQKLLVTTVVVIVLILGFVVRDVSANLIHGILYPVNKTASFVIKPFSNLGTYFSSKTHLTKRNEELENENRMLKIELLSVNATENQNQELKAILNVRDDHAEPRLVGEVVLTPPFSPYDTFVVRISDNFDAEDGDVTRKVDIGDYVFIKNVLVGEVSEVYTNSAIVKLYSTFGEKMPVKINNEIIAEAEGQGGLSFKVEIPKDIEIDQNSPIYSMNFPESIIGFIENIESVETSSFQTIYFQYPFSFNNFNFVEIQY